MIEKILEKAEENEEMLFDLLCELVKIPSVSGEEDKLAKYLNEYLNDMGLDSQIDRHGNVIAYYRGKTSGKKLAFNSHLDTVPVGEGWTRDPFEGKIVGDRIYGRGSTDCKSSIATQIVAVKSLMDVGAELSGEIVLMYPVEEEIQDVSRKGTYKMLKDGFTADMCINGEDTDLNVCIAGGGMLEIKITTLGVNAHGATPDEGKNAIKMMMKVIEEINKMSPGHDKYIGSGSINVGVISGGERSSVVPDRCEMKVSRFTVPGETGAMFYSQINSIIERLKSEDEDFDAISELTYESNPSVISEEEEIVKSISKAHELLGMECELKGTPQHMDADFLINVGNIPTVIYGPGTGKMAHMPNEYVLLDELKTALRVYALTAYVALNK